ncbi:MAG: site-specific integrase [Deltaproteobacteria bacterium]|jgi:integrase
MAASHSRASKILSLFPSIESAVANRAAGCACAASRARRRADRPPGPEPADAAEGSSGKARVSQVAEGADEGVDRPSAGLVGVKSMDRQEVAAAAGCLRQRSPFAGPQAVYLRDFIIIAVNTGMRKGEILSLRRDQIRGEFIYLEKTKTDKARQIPINGDLAECFKSIRKRQPVGTKYIFCDQNGHISDIKTAFNAAVKRAGITDFRPHDLRHTFASHYVMRGDHSGHCRRSWAMQILK